MFKELPIAGEFVEMLLHQNLGTSTSIKPKKSLKILTSRNSYHAIDVLTSARTSRFPG